MQVLVTGAAGFVGSAVLARGAADPGMILRGAYRRDVQGAPAHVKPFVVGDIGAATDWGAALAGVDTVVHTAARVHVMRDSSADPMAEFRRVNVAGTLALARQAAAAGVRRFVFISSIKVNGETTSPTRPYTPDAAAAPVDAYGVSKYEAETGLRRLARNTGLEVVIIRPVLVYGPGVKGNFLSMMRWIQEGIPLPLGAIHNRRSLVALDNLTDLIVTAVRHPAAANQILLVSDGEDLSTSELLRRTASAIGRPARLIPIPAAVLLTLARVLGRGDVARRLCSSLQVDMSRTQELLAWRPPIRVEDALMQTAHWFRRAHGGSHRGASLGRE